MERVIDGNPPQAVRIVSQAKVAPCCDPGRHCAAHGSGPFFCCRCGAESKLAPVKPPTRQRLIDPNLPSQRRFDR